MPSKIITEVAVDSPLVMDAAYRFTAADRRYIDDQVRGCEQQLVDCILCGTVCTWYRLASDSAAVAPGECGCSACDITDPRKVTRVTALKLAAAGAVACVFLESAAPGSLVRCAIGGVVPASITGLAALAGYGIANTTTARVERVASIGPGDYAVGSIDSAGHLTYSPLRPPSALPTATIYQHLEHNGSAFVPVDDIVLPAGAARSLIVASETAANGRDLSIKAGASTMGGGNGGDLKLYTGRPSGGGTAGAWGAYVSLDAFLLASSTSVDVTMPAATGTGLHLTAAVTELLDEAGNSMIAGAAAAIGFYGITPVAQQGVNPASGTLASDLYDALLALGLIKELVV